MNNLESNIKSIVYEEFGEVIKKMENDFQENYAKKRYNFLLDQFDDYLTANMVLVSSFESKSGNAIENCARRIARLRFGEQNVPSIVNPYNIENDFNPNRKNQIIVTDIKMRKNSQLDSAITKFRSENSVNEKEGSGGITQENIHELLNIRNDLVNNEGVFHKPVDLAYKGEDGRWVVMEIKAGGDLDTSNAPSNIDKLLKVYTALNVYDAKAYFATVYHKSGEGNPWEGVVKNYLAYPEMFLIGKDFWNTILPKGVQYENFTALYKEALEELDLNDRIEAITSRYERRKKNETM